MSNVIMAVINLTMSVIILAGMIAFSEMARKHTYK